jgi:hypothetical protein
MNMNTTVSLVAHLVRHAIRTRDLTRLAMAFKAQKPEWGSQGTLVAIGLASALHFLDWELERATERFLEWREEAAATATPGMLSLRSTQYGELMNLVRRPRPLSLAAAIDDPAAPAAMLLPELANRGLLWGDIAALAQSAPHDPLTLQILPDLEHDTRFSAHYREYHPELASATIEQYVACVASADLPHHPHTLYKAVNQHYTNLRRISAPPPPEHDLDTSTSTTHRGIAA